MRKQVTQEQKDAAKAKRAAVGTLAARIAALSAEERSALLKKIGRLITCEGHELSPMNAILVASQCETGAPTLVGGIAQWRKVGRKVRKGAKGMVIFVPCAKKTNESIEGTDQDGKKTFFVCAHVFDASQTCGIDEDLEPMLQGGITQQMLNDNFDRLLIA